MEHVGKRAAKLLGYFRMSEYQRALNVRPAMPPAGKLEVSRADRAHLLKLFQDLFAFHCSPIPRLDLEAAHIINGRSLIAHAAHVNNARRDPAPEKPPFLTAGKNCCEIDRNAWVGYSDSSEMTLEGVMNGSGYGCKAQEKDEVGS